MQKKSAEKRDFLTLRDYSPSEIRQILDITKDVKLHPEKYAKSLEGKQLALLFQKTSTRTRVSFEVGINQLGGNSLYLDWRTTNFTLGDLSDEIKCMSEYVDMIMARVYEHSDVELMARAASVPVINGLSDTVHPCQALADMYTIEEYLGNLKESDGKVVFIGDGGNNVSLSLITICVKLDVPITVIAPSEFCPNEEFMAWLKENHYDSKVQISNDVYDVKGAKVIYTDTFVSMGQEDESTRRLRIFKPYQVNKELLELCKTNPIIMHCLPAHRGVEITSEVLDSERSVVFQQAQNRLHSQKALMVYLMNIAKLKLKIF